MSVSRGDGTGTEALTPNIAPLSFGSADLPTRVNDWTYQSGVFVQDGNAPCYDGHLDATLVSEEKDLPHEVGFKYLVEGTGTIGFQCYLKPLGDRLIYLSVGGDNRFVFDLLMRKSHKPDPEIKSGSGFITPLRYGWFFCRTRLSTGNGEIVKVGLMDRKLRRVYPGDPHIGFYIAHARIDWACR